MVETVDSVRQKVMLEGMQILTVVLGKSVLYLHNFTYFFSLAVIALAKIA
jgi:hypothetical protein